jgi:hypothetical protein
MVRADADELGDAGMFGRGQRYRRRGERHRYISLAAMSNTSLTTLDISAALHPGTNTITIAAQNGPASFGGCTSPCTYQMNPAGVVFGGTLSYH